MRILFLESETRISNVVEASYFGWDSFPDGSSEVFFIDSEENYWHCSSMSLDDFKQYSYGLTIRGYIDLSSFVFVLDEDEAKDHF